MYIIHAGSVCIQRTNLAAGAGAEPILELGPGDFFGEKALVEDNLHPLSARSRNQTELLVFFRPDVMPLSHYHPRLGCKLFLALCRVISDRFRVALAAGSEAV